MVFFFFIFFIKLLSPSPCWIGCSMSIFQLCQFAIWRAPVYILCIHSWKNVQTLSRQTSSKTFACCLRKDFHFNHTESLVDCRCSQQSNSEVIANASGVFLWTWCSVLSLEIKITRCHSKNTHSQTSVTITTLNTEIEMFFVLFCIQQQTWGRHHVTHATTSNRTEPRNIRMSLATECVPYTHTHTRK